MIRFLTATAAAFCLAAAAAQAQPAAAPRACFYARDISNFHVVDDRTVYLRVGVNQVYRLDLMGDCPQLSFRQSLGVETTPGAGTVCSPLDVELVYRDLGAPVRCPVTGLRALTPAEAAALPKKDRP
jgi:hypothetical protein